ncbi:MAG: hypothetical protein AB7K04_10120 [Pseudorhodoplanes sp.]
MTHLMDKHSVEKAGAIMTEGVVFGGFAACALAALLFDIWSIVQ